MTGRVHHFNFAAGDITLNSTSWDDLGVTDLVLPFSKPGDIVEVGLCGVYGAEASIPSLDVGSLVSAAIVNVWSRDGAEAAAGNGVTGWAGFSGVASAFGASVMKALVAGDIEDGVLTLRFRYKTAAAADKTLLAGANDRVYGWAKNHGPRLTS